MGAGSAASARRHFAATGELLQEEAGRPSAMPRPASQDPPAVAAVRRLAVPASSARAACHLVLVGYDDVASVLFFGTRLVGYWTRAYPGGITHALAEAAGEFPAMAARSERHAASLRRRMVAAGGAGYAAVGALAARQTLAATKLVRSPSGRRPWLFLKEISTNGMLQTTDVVFPASPMLLALRPGLLRMLLEPTLAFAGNHTRAVFTDPFSPHQLGFYPTANATTRSQEPMPMENTGNMFLMLLALVQRAPASRLRWLFPRYWPLLSAWAEYLDASLPYPAQQLCTDDFTGPLANNTNLAAKGIVALEAFAQLCVAAGRPKDECAGHSAAAARHADTWRRLAFEAEPAPHLKIAYQVPDSYSLKYNLLWQRLLRLRGPFALSELLAMELPYYAARSNRYGTPLDMRHDYVKLDWAAWAAAMAPGRASFAAAFAPVVRMLNETPSRVPMTDLYDTITGRAVYEGKMSFVARPVVGGVFARLLLAESSPPPLALTEAPSPARTRRGVPASMRRPSGLSWTRAASRTRQYASVSRGPKQDDGGHTVL